MNTQDKIYNAIENAKTLRNEILWKGLTSDEELSEDLQEAFENVSLAIVHLILEARFESNGTARGALG